MNSEPHINLTFRHEVRLRLPEGRRLLALSLMAKEIAGDHHAWWNTNGYTIFAFATLGLRDRFEAEAVEIVNGSELSWDQILIACERVRARGR